MSNTQPHITATAGTSYLQHDGRRVQVTKATANRIDYLDLDAPAFPLYTDRAAFERELESIIE